MKRKQAVTLGEVLRDFMDNYGMTRKMKELDLIDHYEELVGVSIAAYTRQKFIRSGILHIDLYSSAARNEIMMNKKIIILHFNEKAGEELIKDIRLI